MTTLDALTSGLGDAVGSGHFTLDRDRAKEKLRHFQLADPCAWLLEAVRAAVALGASFVDVDTDADDVRLSFDGRAVIRADVEEIYAALLAKNVEPARAHLAVALNAVMALEPRFVRLLSGGAGGVRFEMRPNKPDVIDTLSERGANALASTTSIHVREQFRAGHFVEFFRARLGTQRELLELRRAGRFCGVPLSINGERVAQHSVGVSPSSQKGERGALVLLHRGLVLEEQVHPLVPAELVVAFEGTELMRDASMQAFIRDARFNQLLDAQLVAALDASEARGATGVEHAALAFGQAVLALSRGAREQAFPQGLVLPRLATALGEKNRACRQAPLFVDARGGVVNLHMLAAELQAHGRVRVVRRASEEPNLAGLFVALRNDLDAQRLFGMLGSQHVDGEEELRAAERRARGLTKLRRRWSRTALPPDTYLARQPLRGTFTGELGLRRHGASALVVSFFADGCLIGTEAFPCPLPGLALAVEGPFHLNDECDAVKHDGVFLRALAEAWREVPALLAHIARDLAHDELEWIAGIGAPFLLWTLDADALEQKFLADVAVAAKADLSTLDRASLAPLPRVVLTGDDAHAIARVPFLRRSDGSLVAIEVLAAQPDIAVIPPDVERFSDGAALPAGDVLRQVLAKVRPLKILDERAHREVRRQMVLRTAARAPRFVNRGPNVRFGDDALGGMLVVGSRPGVSIVLSIQGRAWTEVQLPTALGPLEIHVDDVRGLPLADGGVEQASLLRYLELAAAAVPELAEQLVSASITRTDVNQLLGSLTTALTPRAELRRAADVLATARFLDLWSLLETDTEADLAALLELLREVGDAPTAERVRALRTELAVETSSDDPMRKLCTQATLALCGGAPELIDASDKGVVLALRARHPALDRLVFREVGGGAVTLGELWPRRGTAAIGFVPAGLGGVEGFSYLVLDEGRRAMLALVLGPDVLVDKSDEVVRAAALRRFEARPLETTALDAEKHLQVHRFSEGEAQGEVGLLAPRAGMPIASVRVLSRGRFITRLDLSDRMPCSLVAAIDDPSLPLTSDLSGIATPGALAQLTATIARAADDALDALCARLDDAQQTAALRYADAGLIVLERISRVKSHPTSSERLARWCGARLLFNARGGWLSVIELRAAAKEGRGCVTGKAAPSEHKDDGLLVAHAPTAGWRRLLESAVGPELKDAEPLWAARAAVLARKASLRAAPAAPPDAIATIEHVADDVKLSLWLAPAVTDARIHVGAEGRVVLVHDARLPLRSVGGFVDAPRLVAADWTSVDVDGLEHAIEYAALLLARRLLSRASGGDARACELARLLALTLAGTFKSQTPRWREFLDEVQHLPLFDVDDGARVSLSIAIAKRPRAVLPQLIAHGLVERPTAPKLPPPEPLLDPWSGRDLAPREPAPVDATPPPPPPEQLLRARIEETLGLVELERHAAAELLRWPLALEHRKSAPVVVLDDGRTRINIDAPLVAQVLASDDDPAPFFLLCALVYGAINAHLDDVTPAHERAFLARLLSHAHSAH